MRAATRLAATLCLISACATRAPAPQAPLNQQRAAPAPAAAPAVTALEPEPAGRLPAGVTPTRYALTLDVDPARDTFSGVVEVRVRLDAPRDALWLHGEDLTVTAATVTADGSARPARWSPGARAGVAALRWEGAVGPGEVTLRIEYTAPFNRQLEGLYKVENQGDAYAFTQFEAIAARRAFPCFDEPRFKTPFDITMVVPRAQAAITNTPEVSSEIRGESRAVRFAVTEPLPTYLLAFAVGPLDVVEHEPLPPNAIRTQPVPLRGVAPRGRGRFLQRALDDAAPLVAAMERYFNHPYPYPKLDLIAVPDFAAGAMENAGAITFREPLLVLRPGAPQDQIRAMDGVLAHELAHHWFGDLVTLAWWDDIWLNESFATWAAAWATDEVFPQHRHGRDLVAGIHRAMGVDALAAAVPVRRPIEADADLRGGSSAIVYAKGAAVLGMVERWMGRDVFREGIRAFIRDHVHGTAVSSDLVGALARAAGDRPVEPVLRAFIEQPGVPVLAVQRACEGGSSRARFSQRRFALPAGSDTRPGRWPVPVCVRFPTDNGPVSEACGIIDEAHADLALPGARCPAWVMPNAGARGYYRWTLPPAELAALAAQGWDALSTEERLSTVNNARAMFSAGSVDLTALRPLLVRAAADPARVVATDPFPFWQRLIEDHLTPAQGALARRDVAALYGPTWRALGWSPRPGEDADRALLRRDLAHFLGLVIEDPAVRAEGARRGAAYLRNPASLPPELIGPSLAMHLRGSGDAVIDSVITRFVASDDAVERFRLLGALGQTSQATLTSRVLPLAIDPRVRVNETFTALNVALDRGPVREAAFGWFVEHLDAVLPRVSPHGRAGLSWLGARFCTPRLRDRVESVFETFVRANAPGGEGQLRGALESISVCIAEHEAQRVPSLARAYGGAPAEALELPHTIQR